MGSTRGTLPPGTVGRGWYSLRVFGRDLPRTSGAGVEGWLAFLTPPVGPGRKTASASARSCRPRAGNARGRAGRWPRSNRTIPWQYGSCGWGIRRNAEEQVFTLRHQARTMTSKATPGIRGRAVNHRWARVAVDLILCGWSTGELRTWLASDGPYSARWALRHPMGPWNQAAGGRGESLDPACRLSGWVRGGPGPGRPRQRLGGHGQGGWDQADR